MSVPSAPNGKHILVTGGTGYIGSHTVLELVNQGFGVTVIDNLSNSSDESLRRVGELTGKPESIAFHKVDVCRPEELNGLLELGVQWDACIHFAALKAVGESVGKPVEYYKNNIYGTLCLIEMLEANGCCMLIFSSSATTYGSAPTPYTEDSQTGVGVGSPYGRTKVFNEEILKDLVHKKESKWKIVLLRYFNPVGAHPSGRIGEDPTGIPNNLMPYISQVCVGKREHLTVFGGDYETKDGTCERDYIHVVDLAQGHVAALEKHLSDEGPSVEVYNLGSGEPVSVLSLVKAMQTAVGKEIKVVMGDRRAGDLPAFYANTSKAEEVLGWKTKLSIEDICRDSWNWQSNNPNGYNDES
eukprot:TRINITY_DN13905_c0_g1_i1.p1 TRINITY_DN13905_c0_g1~~TRINITY_DN13905_c0_g1_i1.p1  ORF type:complete len:356 (-),score=78.04 TRINITY_DN13905_c0_g1_i1:491-1558(-)